MTVSVCPSFFCNCHCDYCYLGNKTFETTLLDLKRLDVQLHAIAEKSTIDRIELFGGDLTLLDDNYLQSAKDICKMHCNDVNAIVNATRDMTHIFDNVSYSLNVERPDYSKTLDFIKHAQHEFSLNITVLPSVVKMHKAGMLVDYLASLPKKCKSLFLIRYSDSVAAKKHYAVNDIDYEDILLEVSKKAGNLPIRLQNIADLEDYDPLMSSNIFILPDNTFAWICYDSNSREYFKKSSDINEYYSACKSEYNIYIQKCGTCKYFKHCYAEHLDFNKQCSGHKRLKELIDENGIFEADKQMQFAL